MSQPDHQEAPLVQRLYDRVWLLAALAVLFWAAAYVAWGLIEVFSVPGG